MNRAGVGMGGGASTLCGHHPPSTPGAFWTLSFRGFMEVTLQGLDWSNHPPLGIEFHLQPPPLPWVPEIWAEKSNPLIDSWSFWGPAPTLSLSRASATPTPSPGIPLAYKRHSVIPETARVIGAVCQEPGAKTEYLCFIDPQCLPELESDHWRPRLEWASLDGGMAHASPWFSSGDKGTSMSSQKEAGETAHFSEVSVQAFHWSKTSLWVALSSQASPSGEPQDWGVVMEHPQVLVVLASLAPAFTYKL